jgi:uridine phosphorylase
VAGASCPATAAVAGAAAYPILEHDPDPRALIEPSHHLCAPGARRPDLPRRALACFFGDVVRELASERRLPVLGSLAAEHGEHPVYELVHRGERLCLFQPGVGAPLAAFLLEEVVDYGVRAVVACGAAGALVEGLDLGHPVVVGRAIREEGTSYHYLPPSRTVDADAAAVAALSGALEAAGVVPRVVTTWTTDAPYRETAAKVARRRSEGAATVEMEAAALLAVARFRSISLGVLLSAGDSLAGEEWDHRGWTAAREARERCLWLAADAALRLPLPEGSSRP